MPELPEVETVKRIIEPQIKDLKIVNVTINRPEVIAYPNAEIFAERLKNQVVGGIERKGKYLTLLLKSGDRVSLHLRMTGCLMIAPPRYTLEKHTHIIFYMENEWELRFVDVRRFGRLWYIQADEKDTVTGIGSHGKDPFDSDFNSRYLKERFGKCKKPIKECLLNQKVIAGIGNIYSDEILYVAEICPLKPANTLTENEWEQLAAEIPRQLGFYIEKNYMSPEDYLAGKGRDYRNTPYLKVYGKAGSSCPKCNAVLTKCVVGGRSSVYCPVCQR